MIIPIGFVHDIGIALLKYWTLLGGNLLVKFHVIEAFLGLWMENFFTFLQKKAKEIYRKFWTANKKAKTFFLWNLINLLCDLKFSFVSKGHPRDLGVKVVLEQTWTLTRVQTVWPKSQVGASLLICYWITYISDNIRSWRFKLISINSYFY